MAKKKNSKSTFNRQRNAAKKAQAEKNWTVALRNYSKALKHDDVSLELRLDLTQARADVYRKVGDLEGLAADLDSLTGLQQTQIEEKNQSLKQSQAELEILSNIAEALVDQAGLARIGQIVGQRIQQFFGAEIAAIGLYDEKSGMVSVPYYYEKGKLKQVPSFSYGEGVASHVIMTRKPLYIPTNEAGKKYGAIYSDELPSETSLYAPIISGKKAIGTITIQHSEANAYSKHELDLLVAIANSMAVAIENARLFDESQERLAELEVINTAQDALASKLEIKAIYHEVGEKVREIFKAQAVVIESYDLEREKIIWEYAIEKGQEFIVDPIDFISFTWEFIEKGTTLLLNEGYDEFMREKNMIIPEGEAPKSWLATPLKKGGKVSGSIHLSDMDHEHAFSQSDVQLLETLAKSTSIAMENARLFDESQQRLAELEVINTAQDALASKLDIKAIYREVGQKLREIFEAQTVVIYSFNIAENTRVYEYAFEKGEELDIPTRDIDTVSREVISKGQTFLMNEGVSAFNKKNNFKIVKGEEPKSVLTVLLKVAGEVRGGISLQDMDREHAFSQSDVQLLETLAKSTSIALENARLFDESEQRNAELAIVNTAQDALAAKLETKAIFEEVGDKIREIFKAQTVVLYTYDLEKNLTIYEYTFEDGERFAPESVPINQAHREFIDGGKTMLINEGMDEFLKRTKAEITTGKPPKSILSVLLKVSGVVRGAISLQDVDREHAFKQSDVQLLETLAKSTSIALENARLFDEINASLERQTANSDILSAIANSPTEIQPVLDAVAANAARLCEADDAQIYTIEGKELHEVAHFGNIKNLKADESLPLVKGLVTGRAALEHRTIHVEDYEKLSKTKFPVSVKLQKKLGHKTTLVAPLLLEGKAIGAVVVRRKEQRPFSDKQITILENFAKQAVIAIDKARLFTETNRLLEETTQRNAELAVINSVQQALVSQLDLEGIYEAVGEKIQEIFDAQVVIIATVDQQKQTQTSQYLIEKGERFYPGTVPISGIMKHMLGKKNTVIVNENFKDFFDQFGSTIQAKEPTKSAVYVPLKKGRKIFGVISIQNVDRENAFADGDISLLETLANTMSLALQNAELYDETTKRNAELAVINSVQQALVSELDIEAIYEALGLKIQEIFDAEAVIIGTFDQGHDSITIRFMVDEDIRIYPDPVLVNDLAREIFEYGETVVINSDFDAASKKYGLKDIGGTPTKSGLFVPLKRGKEVFGSISLQSGEREYAFADSDVRLLETLANTMSIALQNAELYDETTKRNAELAVINSLQDALAKELDIKGIYNAVGDQIKEIFDAQAIMIGSFDHKSKLVSLPYFYEKGEKFELAPAQQSLMNQRMIRDKKALVVNENLIGEAAKLGMVTPAGEESKSGVWIPIILGKEVTGFVSLQNIDRENAFPESDVQLLTTVTNSMAVALESARLFDEIVQRNAELDIINSVGEAMAQQLDVATVTKIVGDKVRDLFAAEAVFIGLFEEDDDSITFPYLFDEGRYFEVEKQPRGGLSQLVKETRRPQVFNTVEEQENAGGIVIDIDSDDDVQTQSWMGVPIITADNVIGLVSVQSYQIAAFNQSDVQLLSTLATNMGVAIRNAQLYQEVQRRASEMAVLAEVGEEISQELELNALLEQIATQAMELLNGRNAIIRLAQEDGSLPAVVAVGTLQEVFKGNVISIEDGITGHVVRSGIAEMVNNPLDDSRISHVPGTDEDDEAIIFAPLNSGDKAIGVLVIWREKSKHGEFSETDLNFGVGLARQAAIAITNAQLFNEATQRAEEMAALAEVGEEISQELDVVTLLQQIASRALKLLNGSDAVIRLVNEDGTMPAIVDVGERAKKMTEETVSQTVNEGINGFVAQSGKAEIINSIAKDPRAVPVPGLALDELGHAMFVPLRSKDEVIGVMTIFRSGKDQEPFDEDDLKFVVSLARQAAIAMGNANLFEEVQRQKEYFESLLVNNPAAVLTVDIEERTVTSWNPAAENLFGYTEEEAIGKYVDDLVANHPDLKEEAEAYSTEAIELGKVKVKTRRTRKDGSLIDVEVQGLPVKVDGEQKGFIVIYHDISELEAARLAAEEANHAKSAFLANMSHELRTPLNAIIGFTRIVKRKGAEILPEKQSGNLDKVLVSAEHLLGLINTILDIAKIEAGRMDVHLTSFNVQSLIDLCVTTTQSLIDREKVRLISVVPNELPMINSDQDKIKQILLNLLSNAAKFTSEGEIKIEASESEGQMRIAVTDSGIGISEKGLEKIFEEFSQVDESTTREYGGTGLGLSISRSLAQLMGGDISVTSEEGTGSTFILSFPAQYNSSANSSSEGESLQAESVSVAIDHNKPVVLAIDDNPDVVSILKENLEDAGYQVIGALGGNEGVQKARELLPHAITLDIMMPNKDGWQVLYELKHDARTKDIPVIILSIVDKKALGFRLGASDYLVKPLNEKAVLESLNSLVQAKGGTATKRVLVVDDDHTVIDMVSQLLDGEGFSIEEAANGVNALEKLESFSPDVILLDLLMPKMDGFEFLEIFHKIEKYREIPIIILTAKSLSNAEMTKLDDHVSEIIQKQGLESKRLITEIRKTIGKGIL
jgi:PAS domain S-box-containing protein